MAETIDTNNILQCIRKTICGNFLASEFDEDILMHINSAMSSLAQIGACCDEVLVTAETDWDDIFEDQKVLNLVKPYVYYNVRLGFDPPANSAIEESMKIKLQELEFRIIAYTDRWR